MRLSLSFSRRLVALLWCLSVPAAPVCAQTANDESAQVTIGIPLSYLFIAAGMIVLACVWFFVIVPFRRRKPLRKALAILVANDEADFPEAEKLLSGVLTAGMGAKSIKVGRFALAYVRARQRKYSEAATVLVDLKESGPLDRESLYLEAWVQHRLKNYEQVEELFDEHGEILGDMLDATIIHGIALLKRARLHWQRREFEKAIQAFEGIRTLNVLVDEIPSHLDSHQIVMGIMALRDRDFSEARTCFKNALSETMKGNQPTYNAELGLLLCDWNDRAQSGWSLEHDERLAAILNVLPEKSEGIADRKYGTKETEPLETPDESLDKKLDQATLLLRNVRFWHAISLLQICFHLPAKKGLPAGHRKQINNRLSAVSKIDPEMPDPLLVAGLVNYYFAEDDDERARATKILRAARDKGVNLPEVVTLLVRIDKAAKFAHNQLPAFLAFVRKFLVDQSVPPYLRERLKEYFDRNKRFKTLGEIDIEKGEEDPLGWLGNLQGRCNIVLNGLNRHLKPQLAKADPTNRAKAEALLKELPSNMKELLAIAKRVEEDQANALVITAQVVFPEEEGAVTREKIVFACPHCQTKLRIDAEHAGKKANCMRCKKVVQIPDGALPIHSANDARRQPNASTPG